MKKNSQAITNLTADDLIDACEIVTAELGLNLKSVRKAVKAPAFCSLEGICRNIFFDDLRKGKDSFGEQAFIDALNRREGSAKEKRRNGEAAESRKTNILYALADVILLYLMEWGVKNATVQKIQYGIIAREAESIAMIMKSDCSNPEKFTVPHEEIARCARNILTNKHKRESLILDGMANANFVLYEGGSRGITFDMFNFFKEAEGIFWDYVGADYFTDDGCSLEEAVECTIRSSFEGWFLSHYSAKYVNAA